MEAFVKEIWKIVRRKFNMPIVRFFISIVLTIADCCFIVSTLCLSLYLFFAKYVINFVIAFFGFHRKDGPSDADTAAEPSKDQGPGEITTPEKNPFATTGISSTPPASGIELIDMISEKPCDQLQEIEQCSKNSTEVIFEENAQYPSSQIGELKAKDDEMKRAKNGAEDSEAEKIKCMSELTTTEETDVKDSPERIEKVKETKEKTFSSPTKERPDVSGSDIVENKEVKGVLKLVIDDVEKRDAPESGTESKEETGLSTRANEKIKKNAPKTTVKVEEIDAPEVVNKEVEEKGDLKVSSKKGEERNDTKVSTKEVEERDDPKVATKEVEEKGGSKVATKEVEEKGDSKVAAKEVEERDDPKVSTKEREERGDPKVVTKDLEGQGGPKVADEERGDPKAVTKDFAVRSKQIRVFGNMVREVPKIVIENVEKMDATMSVVDAEEESSMPKITIEEVKENAPKTTYKEIEKRDAPKVATEEVQESASKEVTMELEEGSVSKMTTKESEAGGSPKVVSKEFEDRREALTVVIEDVQKRDVSKSAINVVEERGTQEVDAAVMDKRDTSDTTIEKVKESIPKTGDLEKSDKSKKVIEIRKERTPQVVTEEVEGRSSPTAAATKTEKRGTSRSETKEVEDGTSMPVIKDSKERVNLQPVTQELISMSLIKEDNERSDTIHTTEETEKRVSPQQIPKKGDERSVHKVMAKEGEKLSVSKQENNEAEKTFSTTKGEPEKATLELAIEKRDALVSKSVIKDGVGRSSTSEPMIGELDKSFFERANKTRANEKMEESTSNPVTGKVENVTFQPTLAEKKEVTCMPVVKKIKNISVPVSDTKGISASEGVFESSISKTAQKVTYGTGGLMSVTEGAFGQGVSKCQTLGALERETLKYASERASGRGILKSTSEEALGRGVLMHTSDGAVGRGILKSTSEGSLGRGILMHKSEGAVGRGIIKSTSEEALKGRMSKQADEASEKDFKAKMKLDRAEDDDFADFSLKSRNVASKKSKAVKWEDSSVKSDSRKDSSKKFKKNR